MSDPKIIANKVRAATRALNEALQEAYAANLRVDVELFDTRTIQDESVHHTVVSKVYQRVTP